MTDDELKIMLTDFIGLYHDLKTITDQLAKTLGMTPESELSKAVWRLVDAQITLIERIAECDSDWLSWYIFENDCGIKGLEAGFHGAMRSIKTVDDLVWIMRLKGVDLAVEYG